MSSMRWTVDDLGELLVIGGIILFVCNGEIAWNWAYALGMVIVGATLYFIDRAIKRAR